MTAGCINGRTRLCFVIGDPILQLRTPQALNALAGARGIDAIVVPFHVRAVELPAAMAAFRIVQNLNGLVVTVPHKVAAVGYCDELTARAKRAEAVNVIRRESDGRMVGDLVDGIGFVGALARAHISVHGRRIYVAGAGGVARAIALALAEAGIARIGIANRTEHRARALVERVREAFPDVDARCEGPSATGYDLVVNATSLGLSAEDRLPLDPASLKPEMVVADVVMQPPTTPLLRIAAEIGCRIQPGHTMLEAQLELLADHLGLGASA